jgi:hypothetical protein
MSLLQDKQDARDRAERAQENAARLRLAEDHLRTAAALIAATAWDMIGDDSQTGFGLTICGGRDRARHLGRECGRWARDEEDRRDSAAADASPLELR